VRKGCLFTHDRFQKLIECCRSLWDCGLLASIPNWACPTVNEKPILNNVCIDIYAM
jgi:hypothetical protein